VIPGTLLSGGFQSGGDGEKLVGKITVPASSIIETLAFFNVTANGDATVICRLKRNGQMFMSGTIDVAGARMAGVTPVAIAQGNGAEIEATVEVVSGSVGSVTLTQGSLIGIQIG
jgi:hypothetical protein